MNDLDVLTDRLHELGERAPVPTVDPHLDVRRGRAALRRRHARSSAGVLVALTAVGVTAASVPALDWSGGSGETGPQAAGEPSTSTSPSPTSASTPAPGGVDKCAVAAPSSTVGAGEGSETRGAPTGLGGYPSALEPAITAALAAYREAAGATLDPAGRHLDPPGSKRSDNVQTGIGCDPATGEHLTSLGTKLGWTSGGALGVVEVEVALSEHDDEMAVLARGGRWDSYDGPLPAGVIRAQVDDDRGDGSGHAVVVERADGLTVAVLTSAVWGNNAAPGAAPATDLPNVDDLLTFAASPLLTLPGR